MPTTAYVIDPDPGSRRWIESALARSVEAVIFLERGSALLDQLPRGPGHCLIASVDANDATTLELVRALRSAGASLPVIVLGPHSAFRTAVDIARLDATDFLETPVSERQLRTAVRHALQGVD